MLEDSQKGTVRCEIIFSSGNAKPLQVRWSGASEID
jgi:hypothetical protein